MKDLNQEEKDKIEEETKQELGKLSFQEKIGRLSLVKKGLIVFFILGGLIRSFIMQLNSPEQGFVMPDLQITIVLLCMALAVYFNGVHDSVYFEKKSQYLEKDSGKTKVK